MPGPAHGLPPMVAPPRGGDAYGETPRPPFDPTTQVIVDAVPFPVLTPEAIVPNREASLDSLQAVLSQFPALTHREESIPGYEDEPITVSIWRRRDDTETGPGFVWVHGGGMVGGYRFSIPDDPLHWLTLYGGTMVSVEYRLAPENPAPIPVEDCYAGLTWTAAHAADLGLDPARIVLSGGSAGGGLAAGAMLLARDRGGPALLGVMLMCPMLDDRNSSTSVRQHDSVTVWNARANEVGWTALLGAARGTDDVSPYDAPGRASWLGGLPPVHIGVGSSDPFRDEDTAFATAIWRDGGDCELHVVPGGMHGFEALGPDASIARSITASRESWLARLLTPDPTDEVVDQLLARMATLQQLKDAAGA
ncbi:MAG TPA: alpha/beta hydrolase [Propionibacteriaceae bacterium]|nr:alpha/beta hydrolase [Propionibacteriaceae bacterium]